MGLRTFGVQMIGDSDRFPQAFQADARVSSIPIPIPTPTPMRGKPPAEGAEEGWSSGDRVANIWPIDDRRLGQIPTSIPGRRTRFIDTDSDTDLDSDEGRAPRRGCSGNQ
jgi:hypothetical protein